MIYIFLSIYINQLTQQLNLLNILVSLAYSNIYLLKVKLKLVSTT